MMGAGCGAGCTMMGTGAGYGVVKALTSTKDLATDATSSTACRNWPALRLALPAREMVSNAVGGTPRAVPKRVTVQWWAGSTARTSARGESTHMCASSVSVSLDEERSVSKCSSKGHDADSACN